MAKKVLGNQRKVRINHVKNSKCNFFFFYFLSLAWLADCRGGLLKVDQWLDPKDDSKISSSELTSLLEDSDGTKFNLCLILFLIT